MTDATEVFKQIKVEGRAAYLQCEQLDPKFFTAKIKRPIENIGGKWSKEFQCFMFDFDPTAVIAELASGKNLILKSKYHYFGTPTWLACHLFQFAQEAGIQWWKQFDAKTARCLEPSAGQGSLLKRLTVEGFRNLFYYELMPENREVLGKELERLSIQATYLGEDFMKGEETGFDLIVSNPPFRDEKKHIAKMLTLLNPGGIILTLSSPKLYTDEAWFASIEATNPRRFMMRELESDKGDPIFEGTKIGCCVIAIQNQLVDVQSFEAPPVYNLVHKQLDLFAA